MLQRFSYVLKSGHPLLSHDEYLICSFKELLVSEFQVDVSVAVYLNSIIPFLRLLGNEDMEVERRTGHNGLCYCGRFDAAVRYRFFFHDSMFYRFL